MAVDRMMGYAVPADSVVGHKGSICKVLAMRIVALRILIAAVLLKYVHFTSTAP